jgi:hypothetical protein
MKGINDMASNASRAAHGDPAHAAPKAQPSAAHTPGPWVKGRYGELQGSDGATVCVKGLGVSISLSGDPYPVAEANARLIAAAPDMYEALKEAERILDYFANGRTSFVGGGTPRNAHEMVRAAIARAENPS